MTRFKKRILFFFILLLLLVIFRGPLFRTLVTYQSIGVRNSFTLTNPEIIQEIEKITNLNKLDGNEIAQVSLSICAEYLKFSFKPYPADPNKLIQNGRANCIGYSGLFNAVSSYITKKQGHEKIFQFSHLIGKISFLGIDIHRLFNSSFFKDHDFNQIINLETGDTIFVDPSMYDYLRVKRISAAK